MCAARIPNCACPTTNSAPHTQAEDWVREFDKDGDDGLNAAEFKAMMEWQPPDE